ncbi:MAG: hypothetical protein AB7L94_41305 [Kofleriaceae bacterium]
MSAFDFENSTSSFFGDRPSSETSGTDAGSAPPSYVPDFAPAVSTNPAVHRTLHSIFVGDDEDGIMRANAPATGSSILHNRPHPLQEPSKPTPIVSTDRPRPPFERPVLEGSRPIIATDGNDAGAAQDQRDDAPALWGTSPRVPAIPAEALPLQVEATLPSSFRAGGDRAIGQAWWRAFVAQVNVAKSRHATMRAVLNAYRNAQSDPELEALRYVSDGSAVDTSTYTANQRTPNQGGPTVGSLFATGKDGKESLQLDAADKRAIQGAAGAVKRGEGNVESSGRATADADEQTKKQRALLKAAGKKASAAANKLQGVSADLEKMKVQRRKSDLQGDLDALQEKINTTKEIISLTRNLASAIAYIAVGDVGDAVGALGDMMNGAIDLVSKGEIAVIKDKIADAELDEADFAEIALKKRYKEALDEVGAAADTIEANQHGLNASHGGRRDAHDEFAHNAAAASGATGPSAAKLQSMLSSIPLVEAAMMKAQQLANASQPLAMNGSAMRGYGMAKANGHPIADAFGQATDELVGVQRMGQQDHEKWKSRHAELQKVKMTILGHQPAQKP